MGGKPEIKTLLGGQRSDLCTWLVGTTKVYPGVGADIVMESITLIEGAWLYSDPGQ
jgi:hypothetical protein